MNRIILLDSGVLGLVTNPNASPEVEKCNRWLEKNDVIIATTNVAHLSLFTDARLWHEIS